MKLWGGRFKQELDDLVEEFTSSLSFDVKLAKYDTKVSAAYAKALAKAGIYDDGELKKVSAELQKIASEIETDKFELKSSDEDIHSAIERVLTERLGEVGSKLHSGRSRNDQIATDMRMFVMDEIHQMRDAISRLQESLILKAEEYQDYTMPGYTHLQRAQPVAVAHHLMAYFWMFERDKARLLACFRTASVLPLGSGALAGTAIPVDRELLAKELGFLSVGQNSMDMCSSRDFVLEMLSCLTITQMHLSRIAEEIILWMSSEFGFAQLPDRLATGSSMMPHKKNPDIAELIRGKFGRVQGSLVALLTTMKGLPLAYNRDMQEDKEGLFDAVQTVKSSLQIMAIVIAELVFNKDKLAEAASDWQIYVTDLMEKLVKEGEPLRKAHEQIGKLVQYCLDKNKTVHQLSQKELSGFNEKLDIEWIKQLNAKNSISSKLTEGSTSPLSVKQQMDTARKILS